MTHADKAEQYFRDGYNCAQAVLLAFADVTGLEDDVAARLASSFGGGLGRLREVCGAVSGAAMVLGLARGCSDPADMQAKSRHYHLVQALARDFREQNGSIICRELLGGVPVREGKDPEARTADYYRKRPCPQLVRQAAQTAEQLLNSTNDAKTT